MENLSRKAALAAALTFSSLSVTAQTDTTTIDILALYSQGVEVRYGEGTESRINQIISVSNKVFADSQLDIQLRLVHQEKILYSDMTHPEQTLYDLTCNLTELQRTGNCHRGEAFTSVDALRQEHGADMVVMLRPYNSNHGGVCGIAWIGGNRTNGDFSHPIWKETSMSVIGLDGPCGDWVTSHELGHNMGLTHSPLQDGSGGTYPWAWGHGKRDDFATIMGYAWVYGHATRKAYNFSTPKVDCYGSPCGVDKDQPGAADAAHALSVTAPQIAAFTPTVKTFDEPEATPEPDSTDKLKQDWLDEKRKLADLRKTYRDNNRALAENRKNYLSARKTYIQAYRNYISAVRKLERLASKANAAISLSNNSYDQPLSVQIDRYNKAIALINSYNAQLIVVNQYVDAVNNASPRYTELKEQRKTLLAKRKALRNDIIYQKEQVLLAKRRYLDSKAIA